MIANERAVDALAETCAALSAEDVAQAGEVIRTKYPHVKPLKKRKTFTKREQIALFMRDGFIDRYSGDRLIFPGVLCILSETLPEVFPYHPNGKTDECHQAWWDLVPAIDHIVPLAFGGTNDDDNLLCTSGKRNMAKSTSTLEQIGWTIHPPGKLEDWDGLTAWFMNYVGENPALLLNNDVNNWYRALKTFLEDDHG